MKVAVIGATARVVGRIAGDEDLTVHGRVEGEIDLRGALRVEVGAVVRARVRVTAVWVGGAVLGDVAASDLLHLAPTARVIGDLRAPRLVIEPGAQVSGEVVVEGEARGSEGPRRSFSAPLRVDGGARAEPQPRAVVPEARATRVERPTTQRPTRLEPPTSIDRPIVPGTSEILVAPMPIPPPRGVMHATAPPPLPHPSVVASSDPPRRRVQVKLKRRGGPA